MGLLHNLHLGFFLLMSRTMILLIIAAVITVYMVVVMRGRITQPVEAPVAEQQQPSTRVMVAKRDLTLGSFVQPAQDLQWAEPPAGSPSETALREGQVSLEDFSGAVVRRPLKSGDMIPASALMKSGDGGFMSAVLEPGLRAVSIAVNAISGNAGFITPGDKVDLIVTYRRVRPTGREATTEEVVVSETFVRDVRVLAVDQMLDNPENKAILAKTITVEVDVTQAEQIAIATEMGKITLALRSLGARPDSQTPPVPSRDLSQSDAKGDFSSRVHIIRGDESENIEFERNGEFERGGK